MTSSLEKACAHIALGLSQKHRQHFHVNHDTKFLGYLVLSFLCSSRRRIFSSISCSRCRFFSSISASFLSRSAYSACSRSRFSRATRSSSSRSVVLKSSLSYILASKCRRSYYNQFHRRNQFYDQTNTAAENEITSFQLFVLASLFFFLFLTQPLLSTFLLALVAALFKTFLPFLRQPLLKLCQLLLHSQR